MSLLEKNGAKIPGFTPSRFKAVSAFFFFFSLSPWFASSLIIMIMIIIKTMTIVSNMND